MAANPNPTRITTEMWRVWEEAKKIIPGVRLGGIYADKPAYHNTVNANLAKYPGNYSIKLPLDLREPRDKARAIDLTMSDAEMKKRTGYLRRAALHPDDDRLDCVREFFGTLDNETVYGLTHDGPGEPWREVESDLTHLWHEHCSIFTDFVNDWAMLEGLLSTLSGVTWEDWLEKRANEMTILGLKKGDTGPRVRVLHRYLAQAGQTIAPSEYDVGLFSTSTSAAVLAIRKGEGSGVTSGDVVDHNGVVQIEAAWTKAIIKKAGIVGPPGPAGKDGVVQPGTTLTFTAAVTADGTVT